jgi:hypothetical protein
MKDTSSFDGHILATVDKVFLQDRIKVFCGTIRDSIYSTAFISLCHGFVLRLRFSLIRFGFLISV